MTAYEYFNKAERCERIAAELYEHLAGSFPSDPSTAALFRQLAQEELQHAARIRMLASRHVHDPGRFRDAADLPNVDAALAFAEQELADTHAGAWGTDLRAVLVRAGRMEERLEKFHAEVVTRFAQPELAGFFAKLALQDREHVNLLWSAAAKLRREASGQDRWARGASRRAWQGDPDGGPQQRGD